jgi:hypothetical protein
MDPVTIGAVLLAILSGAAGEAGSKLWDGVIALVRRPFQRHQAAAAPAVGSGEAELTALQQAPADEAKAQALARVLVARGEADPGFHQALAGWWDSASRIQAGRDTTTNTITGGTFSAPVAQGHDMTITFNTGPAPRAASPAQPGNE